MSASTPLASVPNRVNAGEGTAHPAAASSLLMPVDSLKMQTATNTNEPNRNVEPAVQTAVLLTVRESANWIMERQGRRPSCSTIYAWVRRGFRGHRLASTLVDGVRHLAENDLTNFCEARARLASVVRAPAAGEMIGRSSRRGKPATAERFLKNQLLLPFDWDELPKPCGAAAD